MAVQWLARLALINQAYLRRHAQQVKQEDIARAHAQSEEVACKLRTEKLLNSVAKEAGELIGLLRDYWRGRYAKAPKRVIGAVAFTVLYIANPLDMIPDYIVGFGFLDDVAVVNVAYLLMRKDLEAYRQWRQARKQPRARRSIDAESVEATYESIEQTRPSAASVILLPPPVSPGRNVVHNNELERDHVPQ